MMTRQVGRLTRGRTIALCTIIAAFTAFLFIGTTWGGGGSGHTSPTGQCTVCHGSSLKTIHQESWSTNRTGCYICHPTGRRSLYSYLAGASFDCLSCHTPSGVPVAYHMNMNTKHTSAEAVCMVCHSTGTSEDIPTASLPQVHQGLGEAGHLPLTVPIPKAVTTIEDDIYSYCLECHVNPLRIPVLPDNANCTSCHEAAEYNAKLNQDFHKLLLEAFEQAGIDVTAHTMCTNCHVKSE